MVKGGSTKKVQIQNAAAALFREKGYRGTTMRDIARYVGIEASSLYNHIKSKQELLREMLMNLANCFTEQMSKVNESDLNALERLKLLIRFHVSMTINHTDAISIIPSEWGHLEEPSLDQYSTLRSNYEAAFRQIVEECISEGYFEPVNSEIALFSILSTLRWLYVWYAQHNTLEAEELEQQIIHCLLSGLKYKG